MKRFVHLLLPAVFCLVTAPAHGQGLVINELMADNVATKADEQGQFDDWIELHNRTEVSILLDNYYLSDDLADPVKWQFPAGVRIESNEYLIIWADNDTDDPGLHAGFRINKDGESVYLHAGAPDNPDLVDSTMFGELGEDEPWGRWQSGDDEFTRLTPPTPGDFNGMPTSVGDDARVRIMVDLGAVAPQPAISQASVELSMPAPAEVEVIIVDFFGRRILNVNDEWMAEGSHRITFDVATLPSGMYACIARSQFGTARRPFHIVR